MLAIPASAGLADKSVFYQRDYPILMVVKPAGFILRIYRYRFGFHQRSPRANSVAMVIRYSLPTRRLLKSSAADSM